MSAVDTLEVAVFGPTVVRSNGLPVSLSPRERAVVTALAIDHLRPIALDAVIDAIWVRDPPDSCRQVVQNNVSTLRRRFTSASVVTESGPTYRLGSMWSLDLDRFTRHVDAARRATLVNDHRSAVGEYRRALDLARGETFHDLPSGPVVDARRARLRQLLLTAQEDAVLAELAVGGVAVAIATASVLAPAEPYRELRWSLLALGLYRSGDRRGSLDALQRARRTLRDGVGLDPGPVMLRLERMILDDDPVLADAPPRDVLGLDRTQHVSVDHVAPRVLGTGDDIDRVRALCARSVELDTAVWITVTGDAPIEASAMARTATLDASLDGWCVLEATCHPQARRVLEPLGSLARQVMEQLPDPTKTFEPSVLAGLAALWGDGIERFDRIDGIEPGDAAVEALRCCAQRSPTLVVIEQAQHLSVSALGHLGRLIALPIPMVVLAVGATVDVPIPAGAEVIRLSASRERGATDQPDTDTVSIEDRPGGLIDVATLIVVAGAPLSFEVILGTGRAPRGVLGVLTAGVDAGDLRAVRDGGFDVVNGSIRTAVIEQLALDDRREIHRSLAVSFLSRGEVFAAAPHLLASSGEPELVIENVTTAADQATRAAMFVEAAVLLGEAIERSSDHFGTHDERTLRLMLARSENLRRAGDSTYLDVVWEVVHRSEEAQLNTVYALGAAALCKLGPLTHAGEPDERVARVVADALARCDDAEARARCAGEATLFFSMGGRADLCRAYFDEALALARDVDDDAVMISALGNAYLVLVHPSDAAQRRELAAEMLARADRTGDDDATCEALHFAFSVQLQHCDPMLRIGHAAQDALAQRLGPGRRWMADYQRCCLAYLDGRLDESLDIASHWVEGAPVSTSRALTTYTMALLVVRLAQGRGQELTGQIDDAIAEHAAMPAWRAIAAFLAAERGDIERVLDECDALGNGAALPSDMAWSGAALLMARAVARTGDRERAEQLRELIVPYSGTFTWVGSATVGPFDLALTELSLALGDIADAKRYLVSLERCVDRLGAEVYRPDVERLRALVDHAD